MVFKGEELSSLVQDAFPYKTALFKVANPTWHLGKWRLPKKPAVLVNHLPRPIAAAQHIFCIRCPLP